MFFSSEYIMKEIDVGKKIADIKNDNELKVVEFLRKLGLECIDCNAEVGKYKHQLYGEIDSIFKFQDYLFLVEVSKKRGANQKRFAFFTKWADKDVLKWITKEYGLHPKKIIRLYFEMQGEKPENFPSPFLEMMTKKGKWNKVIYSERFNYFVSSSKKNIQDIRKEFLKELEVSEQRSLKIVLKKHFKNSK